MKLCMILIVVVTGVSAFRQLDKNSLDSTKLKFIPHDLKPSGKKEDFCNGLACPEYSVMYRNETGNFELRKYKETKWVTTDSSGMDYDEAGYKNFMKLFHYIGGDNKKKEKVTMTCPVIVMITPGPGPACSSNFNMSFYIDPNSSDPPQPSENNIYFTKIPSVRAYVRTFGGFADYNKYKEQGLELMDAIGDTSLYHTDFYYTAGYDSPFKFFHRHNEVWFIAK
ncbi:heme-binding protein 2-like [Ylistrum balloti]|uniref:heme-binding protein 2-like n=1 Tax=Ylistrum balloti TaxID=509963 RepID=UPI002905F59A|nr:heme-binding protein 2-like [Ylistrum balloti]